MLKLNKNYGPNVIYKNFIFKNLPRYFAYTDPDIEINKNIKKKFFRNTQRVYRKVSNPKSWI